jgi:hypothetical protein
LLALGITYRMLACRASASLSRSCTAQKCWLSSEHWLISSLTFAEFDECSRKMAKRKKSKKEISERARREAENMPSVRLLRELAAKGWADLEARRLAQEAAEAKDS